MGSWKLKKLPKNYYAAIESSAVSGRNHNIDSSKGGCFWEGDGVEENSTSCILNFSSFARSTYLTIYV